MAENEKLNEQLYNKVAEEFARFKDWLISQPPADILNHTYEYTVKENILIGFEYAVLTDEQFGALLTSPTPLEDIFSDYEQLDDGMFDLISGCIETRANDILEAMPRTEVALQAAAGFVEAHKTDEGIDYTLYDMKFAPVDGGVIEDESLSPLDAAMLVCEENGLANPKEIDHGELMDKVQEAEDRAVEEMNESLMKPPVYKETAAYAMDNGEIDLYRRSMRANVECRMAIEEAIEDNYDGQRLNTGAVKEMIEQFGAERVEYVLANTVQQKDWDLRISQDNKAWAKTVPVCPENSTAFLVDRSHPGLTNLFVSAFRKEVEKQQERKPSVLQKLRAEKEAKVEKQPKSPRKDKEAQR